MPMTPPGNSIISLSIDVGEAFDFGHAVADLADGADVGFSTDGRDAGDLLFEFLKDAAHGERSWLGVSVRCSANEWIRMRWRGGRGGLGRSRRKHRCPTRMRRPPRRAGLI